MECLAGSSTLYIIAQIREIRGFQELGPTADVLGPGAEAVEMTLLRRMTRDRPRNPDTLRSKALGQGFGQAQPLEPPRARQDRILWVVGIESERGLPLTTATLLRTRGHHTGGRRASKATGEVALLAQAIQALDLDRLDGDSGVGWIHRCGAVDEWKNNRGLAIWQTPLNHE